MTPSPSSPAFKAFLSHRYKSPEVNLHFWEVMAEVAHVQFEVDEGTLSISTTRLERLIRDADAFIGVYPLPVDRTQDVDNDLLRHESRYFRLELDMAIRSRTPAIVFHDGRYGMMLPTPPGVRREWYDAQEVTSRHVPTPSRLRVRRACEEFAAHVATLHDARAAVLPDVERGLVGVVMPATGPWGGADGTGAAVVGEILRKRGLTTLNFGAPAPLDLSLLVEVRRCEWIVLEMSAPGATAVAGYLHGQFVPVLRTQWVPPGSTDSRSVPDAATSVLYDGVEVGYAKGLLTWSDSVELAEKLDERTLVVTRQPLLIRTREEAEKHFRSAAQRTSPVFVSYAREDADAAADIVRELRLHFRDVFDYRSPDSIPLGASWVDVVTSELARTAVGVAILSEHYLNSHYCMDEARGFYQARVERGAKLFAVKVGTVDLPPFLTQAQYVRLQDTTPEDFVARIIQAVEDPPAAEPL